MVLPVFVARRLRALRCGSARLRRTRCCRRRPARAPAWLPPRPAGSASTGSGCVADESAIGSGNPGAHVCPSNVAAFKADVVSAVNRMTVSVGPSGAVHISCNAGTRLGSRAIGRLDRRAGRRRQRLQRRRRRSPSARIGRPRIRPRRIHLSTHDADHQLAHRVDRTLSGSATHGHQLGDHACHRTIATHRARPGHRAVRPRARGPRARGRRRRRRRVCLRAAACGAERGRLRGHGGHPHRRPEAHRPATRRRHGRNVQGAIDAGPRSQRRGARERPVRRRGRVRPSAT